MKTRYLALYLMLWSVISCVSHASKQSALKEYDIDIQQRDAISDFVDSYKTLPLETTKDNLIGNINKVQIIDTCIYVLDKEQATIFVFNTEGKYLNKICRQGRAPEEYLGLSDFMVYNADVYCLSHANQKIFVYNMQGDWERTIALDDGYERFYIQDDNTFYLFSDESNEKHYNYIVFNPLTNRVVNQLDEFEKNQGYCYEHFPFHAVDSNLLVTEQYDPTIYRLTPTEKQPLYSFLFNTQDKIYDELKTLDRAKLSQLLWGKEILRNLHAINLKGHILTIAYSIFCHDAGIRDFISRIDLEMNTIKTIRLGDEIFVQYPFLTTILDVHDGWFISTIPAVLAVDKGKELDMFAGLQETDNPVLVLHHIK